MGGFAATRDGAVAGATRTATTTGGRRTEGNRATILAAD
ncbi:MAG: hypothetical protein AVDCRST_MAG49-1401 [uncultured Thermomicrobiales bacterium]|uniref:Uncharacterized protein n=1 Tax=uncultured Thermomicrobiales bacterium TaxID=1645740 RepID=A0A6J4UDF1_9BACT|nr:MAG: hypothetical protein AVDCRST_MAG49-1401 [uncultured Thermomicrobiales bacterium]